ncbi:hypothetical protein CA13_51270 [Planctomycetes bacterium CA13]|uniref:Xylose isomerase-like TIM barrel domain-containing protein n=1 Tax=Novipirellula herctigrandis TaxID=2527986 RepID=A0A5C5Z8Y9_9BACT|nr:hypothetical protein CA13_51270 [Planctomycetes bacterium CA13]
MKLFLERPLAKIVLISLFVCTGPLQTSRAETTILETARDIPVCYDVDVVVVGGTTGAVRAAIAAADNGASVFLAAPRPYLGEDVCGTLRLWLDENEKPNGELEKKLFEVTTPHSDWERGMPLSYQADQPSDSVHRDTAPPSRLTDRRYSSAANDSVQFSNDVTIVANLESNQRVKQLHLLSYQRDGVFEVADVQVWTSPNGTLWRDLGTIKNPKLDMGGSENTPIDLSLTIEQPCKFIKLLVRKTERAERMLLAELVVVGDEPAMEAEAKNRPPTPMQIKYTLDQALIDARIPFLYGSPVTDVLHDAQGELAGVVIANRAGRQVVKAKMVIDATSRASVARIAGASFTDYPSGSHTFERIVVGGEPKASSALKVRKADVQFYSAKGPHDVFVCTMDIPMKDSGFASFAEAEQIMREATFDAALADESDVLFELPPDSIVSAANVEQRSFDPETIALEACQPKKMPRLYVLGAMADVSRGVAEQLIRPLNLMRLGKRIGASAAERARSIPTTESVTISASPASKTNTYAEVKEFLQGVRPTDRNRPVVHSPDRALPILGQYDVVVVGGGTGGAPAAIAAGRRGSKTLLIEYQDHLGGVGTLGLISSYYHGYRKGFSSEVDQGVELMGGPQRHGGWNPVTKREYWRREARTAGCDIWFSTLGCGTLVSGNFVKGVVVVTPQGRGVVLAKTVVDSTGNADVAAAAGAATISTSADHVAMQGTGLSPRALGTGYTNTDYSFSDESDPIDQWRMIVSAREKYKDAYDISPFIDSRERRRIVGETFITPLDLMNNRTYYDTIAMHQSNFDTHGFTVHPVFLIHFPDKKQMTVPVPYRALLPKDLDGVLVTGLGISADRDAMPILRMQACIQNQGYAAGLAASMAATQNTSLRSIDIPALQKHLVQIGSLEPNVLDQQDSPPPSIDTVKAAVQSVILDYRGLSIILDQSDTAIPMLRTAYAAQSDESNRLIYANILGMLGDPTGSELLAKTINESRWDEGWNFRGMGQFGGSLSRLDSLIIALGRSQSPIALESILQKLEQLDASSEFSHHRAVAIGLETLANRQAAAPLANLLLKPGMSGHAITDIAAKEKSAGNEKRSQPLREIILARALYRCGDKEGLGEKLLSTYAKDLRGLFAQHATAVLAEELAGEPSRANKKPESKPLFPQTPGMVSYTYRNEFTTDFEGTLDTIRSLGVIDMEFSNLFGKTASEIRAMLDQRGMKCSSFGVSYNDARNNIRQVAENAKTLGAKFVRVAWIPNRQPFTYEFAQQTAREFNEIGKELKEKHGLTFCYHNHGFEFIPYQDGTLFDVLMANTDPKYVFIELDILWAYFPGADPPELLRRYGDRIKLIHLKDLKKGVQGDLSGHTSPENDVALGTGQLDIPAILIAAKQAGVEHYYIEDESPSIETQVPQTIRYLKSLSTKTKP